MGSQNLYVISYDIVSDKKRGRVANILKDYGIRMQKSVFECRLDARNLEDIMKKLDGIINKKEDSILFYRLCTACEKHNMFLGIKPERLDKEYDIL